MTKIWGKEAKSREIEPLRTILLEWGNHARVRIGMVRMIDSSVLLHIRLSALR